LLIKGFLFLSVILNLILLLKMIGYIKGTGFVTASLSEIRNSGFNCRIHIGNRYKSLGNLSAELNMLMDRFQSTLEEKQKLEVSHKQLISNISHDIRTPLTSLLGFVEVLQNSNTLSREEQKDYLNIIHAKGLFLYKLIQDFFELSKLEAEDTEMLMDKVDLADKAREVLAAFYQDFVMHGIVPEIKLPEHSVYVHGNRAGLERILQNLLSNALKYGKDGGVIGITLREEADRVWLEIWDKGKGIPENDLPLLFNRLYTVEASRNEKMRGSGLGLAIAKQLVEKQNGAITVSSAPGLHTTFSFYLMKFQ
jgi:signal transduction histidine kinase